MNNLDDRHPDLSAGAVRSDNMPTMLNRVFRGFSAASPPGWLHFVVPADSPVLALLPTS